MKEIAAEKRRYGYRRIHYLLRKEGLVMNHKRTQRLYRQENLSIRTKKRKRLSSRLRLVLPQPTSSNQIWAMDFVSDRVMSGRRIKCLTIVDLYTRESLAIHVDTSISGHGVTRVLDHIVSLRGTPGIIVTDNGPEFTSKALWLWTAKHKVKLSFIRPGKPMENAFIESFNGRLREECLNEQWFIDLSNARDLIEKWRTEYNYQRPHSALGMLTPKEFAQQKEVLQLSG